MAKQIIVLEFGKGPGGDILLNFLFWLAIAAGREVPKPNATSLWRGATLADNTALQAGSIIEESQSTQYVQGTSKTQIEADLLARFNTRQTEINNKPNINQFYGIYYDSVTGWSN